MERVFRFTSGSSIKVQRRYERSDSLGSSGSPSSPFFNWPRVLYNSISRCSNPGHVLALIKVVCVSILRDTWNVWWKVRWYAMRKYHVSFRKVFSKYLTNNWIEVRCQENRSLVIVNVVGAVVLGGDGELRGFVWSVDLAQTWSRVSIPCLMI